LPEVITQFNQLVDVKSTEQLFLSCDTTPQALLSIDEALELLLNSAKVTRSTQWLGLDDISHLNSFKDLDVV
jgi:hypothetical protein